MTFEDQKPYRPAPVDPKIFLENPERRCPCVLLLDKSHSMAGQPISELNAGVIGFRDELLADELATKRVEVAIVSFGPVTVDQDFIDASKFVPPQLKASGDTPMGHAILTALDVLKAREAAYKENGIKRYRPWVFLITDGSPTDDWQEAARRIKDGEAGEDFVFFAVGVQDARMDVLNQLAPRGALKLDGLRFRDLFGWLSKSLQRVSASQPDTKVPLIPPGWTEV